MYDPARLAELLVALDAEGGHGHDAEFIRQVNAAAVEAFKQGLLDFSFDDKGGLLLKLTVDGHAHARGWGHA